MSQFILTIAASVNTVSGNAPILGILVNGSPITSSTGITAQTGVGSDILSFTLDYTGNYPSALAIRFNSGSGDPGDSVTIESVRINGQSLNVAGDLTATILAQSQTSSVSSTASHDHLFGRIEPTAGDLGTPTQTGTGGADTLTGTGSEDVIDGGGGNDTIRGFNGDDAINGGSGNDRIFGEDGNDIIIGGTGNDQIFGNEGDDLLFGQDDNDTLLGEDGNDVLNGGAGDDILIGAEGNDILYGGDGADRLLGVRGNNTLYGDAGDDIMVGGNGNDLMYGGNDNDTMNGGAGNDEIYGEAGADFANGGAGTDTIDGGAGADFLRGGAGNDTISGGTENDSIFGDEGVDTLNGDAGDDNLVGGDGADTLNGGTGNDILQGSGLNAWEVSAILQANPNAVFSEETNSFYQLVSSSVTFTGAQGVAGATTLNGVNGHLVTISSAIENAFVNNLAGGNDIWINASDSAVEGEWRWAGGEEDGLLLWNGDSSGSAVNGFYTNWNTGEPNDSGGEDAAEMRGSDGRWNDLDGSSNTNYYIIEWDGSQFSDDNAIDTLNGGDDDDLLLGHGGNDILNGDDGIDHLFGGTGNDTMNGGDDDDFLYDDAGANNFYGNDGDDTLDARFQTAIPSVADQIATYLVENPNLTYNADTGNFYEVVSNQLDWDQARSAAASTTLNGIAGHLGTITTQEEHDFIVSLAIGVNTWLGGSDDPTITGGSYDDWYWVEGPEAGTHFSTDGTAEPGQFTDWNPGQPNDSNNTQNYLYLLNSNDGWADLVIEGDGSTGFVTVGQYLVEWEGTDVLVTPPTESAQSSQYMEGGAGDDTVYGGNGDDTIYGDDPADSETGNDYIEAGDGDDTIYGGQGADEIYGELGSDDIEGGDGNDTIYAAFASGASAIPVSAGFESGTDSFSYTDGTFGSSGSSNSYASGTRITSDAYTGNASLEISLGGINNNSITNMSGSWDLGFTLVSAMSDAVLTFAYRVLDAVVDSDPFDSGEDLHLYAEIDSTQYGTGGNNHFFEILGNDAGASYDSGWQTVSIDIGALSIGAHTLSIGGLLDSKTWTSEEYDVRFDDVVLQNSGAATSDSSATNTVNGGNGNDTIYGSDGTDTLLGGDGTDTIYSGSEAGGTNVVTLLDNSFGADEEDFTYSDGGFGGNDAGNDMSGTYQGGDGNTANGSLQVDASGAVGSNASGSYDASITVGANNLTNVQITFSYRHWQSNQHDNNEDSQIWFEFDGTTYDTGGGNSFINEHQGANGGGADDDTGWVTVTIDLPDLTSGNTYNLSLGILHTGSSSGNEDAYVRFDDISVTGEYTVATNTTTLNGGSGADNLYGSDGNDLFIFDSNGGDAFTNPDTIHDFDENDGDTLDISDILSGLGVNAGNLSQYVDVSSGSGVRIDTTGSSSFGAGTTIATFSGSTTISDEATLLGSGQLII